MTFEPGARRGWHTHPLAQVLIVTSGLGWTQQEDGPVEVMPPGGVVHASRDSPRRSTSVEWMEQVTEGQNLAGENAARRSGG